MTGPEIWFESTRFADSPTEETDGPSPGVYGERLAHWIGTRLTARGWKITGVSDEDWGWLVELTADGCRFDVSVGNEVGESTRWMVQPAARPGLIQRLLRQVDPGPTLARLHGDLTAVLGNDSHTRWIGEGPQPGLGPASR